MSTMQRSPRQHPQEAPSGPRALGALMKPSPQPFSPHRAVSDWGPPMLCSEAPQVPWFLPSFHFPTDKAKFTS